MKNLITGFIAIAILILVGLGCSQSDNKAANNSNTTSNSSSNDNKSNSNSSTSTDSKSNDVAGSYSITGKNPSGQSYNGDLTIKKQESVYQFSWTVGGSSYDGVGVRDGNLIAVGYGAGDSGKGCGAAIYKIGDKTLDGKLGGWGYNQVGIQTAVLLKSTDKGEIYTVSGTDTDGSNYSGELFVATSKSAVYQFALGKNGKPIFVGTGIKVDDYFGAGMGIDKKCGYSIYEVRGDRLEAAWGIIGDGKLGTEIATKK
jgi:hypothetical protein